MDGPKPPSETHVQPPEREKNSKTQMDNSKRESAVSEPDKSVGNRIKLNLKKDAEANVAPLATTEKVGLTPPKVQTCEEKLPNNSVASQKVQQQQQQNVPKGQNIWKGTLEWHDVENNQPPDAPAETRNVSCVISSKVVDEGTEVTAETWSENFTMQLLPAALLKSSSLEHIKASKSVVVTPTPCEAFKSLHKAITCYGYVGCARLNRTSDEHVKIMILAYYSEKKVFVGIIPNDQVAFVDGLHKYVYQRNTITALRRRAREIRVAQGSMPRPMQLPLGPNMLGGSGPNQMLMPNNTTLNLVVNISFVTCPREE